MNRSITLILFGALLLTGSVASADENWTIVPTTNVVVASDVLHRNIRLQIGLPPNYEATNTAYGVVYCLDGFIIGGSLRETANLLHFGHEMPEVITVSIDLEVTNEAEWFKERSFILTPTKSDCYKEYGIPESWTGGGPLFLKALANEITPYIDKHFRTLPGERTLMGGSFSGLFATYVLFESPQLFKRYLISSPSLPWDDRMIFKLESQYAKTHKDLPAKVFLSVGALENAPDDMTVYSMKDFADTLRLRNYAGLELNSIVFENENHLSVPNVAYSRGLRVLYADTKDKAATLSK